MGDHEDLIGLLTGGDQGIGVLQRQRDRFFEEDVFVGSKGCLGCDAMGCSWEADIDGVDRWVAEDRVEVAATWPDPTQLRLAGLPKTETGAGATVFWDTGAALFTYGKNKQLAADYLKALTYDDRIWEGAINGREGQVPAGQVPVYQSVWDNYAANRPEWIKDWAFLIHDQLPVSKAITTHKFGLTQFFIGQPYWEKYLTGDESDPKVALQAAKDAVAAEVAKG